MSTDSVTSLKHAVIQENILDDDSVHHEFASGLHGRKLDMDKIKTGSSLYHLWIDTLTGYVRENYNPQPDALIGIANGANRLAISVAARLGSGAIGLVTEKESSSSVRFSISAEDMLIGLESDFALVLEDVGTSGGTALTAVQKALVLGVRRVEVLTTWQRSASLSALDEAGIPYRTLIYEPLQNYPSDQCLYCQSGSRLIAHA